jgi:hypothetical protein
MKVFHDLAGSLVAANSGHTGLSPGLSPQNLGRGGRGGGGRGSPPLVPSTPRVIELTSKIQLEATVSLAMVSLKNCLDGPAHLGLVRFCELVSLV